MSLDREMAVLLEHDYRHRRIGFSMAEDDENIVEVTKDSPLKSRLREGILRVTAWDTEEWLSESLGRPGIHDIRGKVEHFKKLSASVRDGAISDITKAIKRGGSFGDPWLDDSKEAYGGWALADLKVLLKQLSSLGGAKSGVPGPSGVKVPSPGDMEGLRRARFYIPKNIEATVHKAPPGVYVVQWEQHGKLYAVAFTGNREKYDWYNSFRSQDDLDKKAKATIESYKGHADRKEKDRQDTADFQHKYVVGDILYSSWGYDQTNVEFYEVVAITAKSIKVREIAQTSTSNGVGSDNVMPVKGKYIEPATGAKKVRTASDGYGSIKISSSITGFHWDGRPKHRTAFGYGH